MHSIAHAVMMGGDLKAIDTLLKVSAARCALLGINAPLQIRIDEAVESEVRGALERLRLTLSSENYKQIVEVLAKT
jgi:hypothetical protein